MAVEIGQHLPHLAIRDEHDNRVSVEEMRDGRPVVLFFMRSGTCVVCLRHARTLDGMHDELAARKVMPIVVVPGSAGDAAMVRRRLSGDTRVVSSGDAATYLAAGLGQSMMLQHSGTFLADEGGIVRHAKTATLPTGSFHRGQLLDAIARL